MAQGLFGSGEDFLNGGHFDQWTTPILAILFSPAPKRLHMKFDQHWTRGFRGEVI